MDGCSGFLLAIEMAAERVQYVDRLRTSLHSQRRLGSLKDQLRVWVQLESGGV